MSKKDRAARSGEAAEAPQQLTFIVSFAYEVDGAYEIQATSAEEAEATTVSASLTSDARLRDGNAALRGELAKCAVAEAERALVCFSNA